MKSWFYNNFLINKMQWWVILYLRPLTIICIVCHLTLPLCCDCIIFRFTHHVAILFLLLPMTWWLITKFVFVQYVLMYIDVFVYNLLNVTNYLTKQHLVMLVLVWMHFNGYNNIRMKFTYLIFWKIFCY